MFHIYTDGSTIGNPGPGGWGAVIINGKDRRELSGANPWTTISEMEILAAVEALRSIPLGQRVLLCSDSRYLIDGMSYLARRWRDYGWRNSRGAPIQHRDLWLDLIALNRQHRVEWKWLQGHNGHSIQCRADALAYRAAKAHCRSERFAA
jgi:ribonuclease HI